MAENKTYSVSEGVATEVETKNEVEIKSEIDCVITSMSDKRQYKLVTLENQLQVLLISDPEADKSAASIDVGVGCALDPKPLYGTAHFLEHMLFMGSKKYPSENEYSEFIKNSGGYSNAYTSLTNTNYHFECSN